jgi:hypothetical protein
MNTLRTTHICAMAALLAVTGCTVRNVDTKMTPQLYANGEVVFMYSDIANFAQPHNDKDAEANRLRDLNDWVVDTAICPKGYDIVKRQVVLNRANSEGGKVYYFIKCK